MLDYFEAGGPEEDTFIYEKGQPDNGRRRDQNSGGYIFDYCRLQVQYKLDRAFSGRTLDFYRDPGICDKKRHIIEVHRNDGKMARTAHSNPGRSYVGYGCSLGNLGMKFFSAVLSMFSVFLFAGTLYSLEIESDVFKEGGTIPARYTAQGEDISPPLYWSGVPARTLTFALIMDDPDAPMGTWVHWVLYNLPGDLRNLDEALSAVKDLDNGAKQGINSFRKIGYGGPNPPLGPAHRYIFKLYALDSFLSLPDDVEKDTLVRAMEGHILDEAQLTGKFAR